METLRSTADLIAGFKKQGWLKKLVKQSATAAKFDELFNELDAVLTICGFALEVRKKKGEIRETFFFFCFSLVAGGGLGCACGGCAPV